MSDAMLRFLCPKCGQQLKAAPADVGRKAACHACGDRMLVPRALASGASLPYGEPVRPVVAQAAPRAVPETGAPPKRWVLPLAIAGIAGFVLLVLGVAIVGIIVRFGGSTPPVPPPPEPVAQIEPKKEYIPPVQPPVKLPPPKKIIETKPPAPMPEDPPKLDVKVIETVVKGEERTEPSAFRLAITPPVYDNMGHLLKTLGEGYKYTDLALKDVESGTKLADFDVLFLTCGGSSSQNVRMNHSLRQFVEKGGTLYASDLRFDALRGAFPEFVQKDNLYTGIPQTMTADILDAGLRDALGSSQISLRFDSPSWKAAAFVRDKVTVYLEGDIQSEGSGKVRTPLLVKFKHGKGAVIFTSFHNAAQNSETEKKLLRYLVFTAVTSQTETKVATTMISGGFSPQVSRLLNASDPQQATATYENKKAGPLRFVLGFANQGAKFRLTLVAPSGEKVEREGTATFTVEVPDAAAGNWRYTVSALQVPYPNFPFTLTVGQKVGP